MGILRRVVLAGIGLMFAAGLTTNVAAVVIDVNPGDSVQAAIDAALSGDVVLIHPGTYDGGLDTHGKAITLTSEDPTDPVIVAATIISGGGVFGPVITCDEGEGPGTIISGLTLTNGFGFWNGSERLGGGFYIRLASPTIEYCVITGNTAQKGAGASNQTSSFATYTSCVFSNNVAFEYGGGMANTSSAEPTITDCQFIGNSVNDIANGVFGGGGIYNHNSSPRVDGCLFQNNTAASEGGAILSAFASAPVILRSTFINNSCPHDGGAICSYSDSTLVLASSVFHGNTSQFGGAILTFTAGVSTVANCVFSGNLATTDGGGVRNVSTPVSTFFNCTFVGNEPYAISGGVNTQLYNSIMSANVPESLTGTTATVRDSLIEGGYPGVGVIDADPLFVDADGPDGVPGTADDNFQLVAPSPCIDVAPNFVAADTADLDNDGNTTEDIPFDLAGISREVDGDGDAVAIQDMGAYEFDGINLAFVYNVNSDLYYGTIPAAIQAAAFGDSLIANTYAADSTIDFDGKPVRLSIDGVFTQGSGLITMADGSTLATESDSLTIGGDVECPVGIAAAFDPSAVFKMNSVGTLSLRANSSLWVDTGETLLGGSILLEPGAVYAQTAGATHEGSLVMYGGVISAPDFHNSGGTITGYGDIVGNIENDADVIVLADMQIVGDFQNDDLTTIQNGTLTILGTLTNNGQIIGDFSESLVPPALSVFGSLTAAVGSELHMPPGATTRIEGDFDVTINDSGRYDLSKATLQTIGISGAEQVIEMMSLDIGAVPAGLDRAFPGHFPIGTLRLGPGETTVRLTDTHDNDGLGQRNCEAIYVEELIIEANATLVTDGCPVYYVSLVNNGVVDDPSLLIPIVVAPPCPADTNHDGAVTVLDLLGLLGAWSTDDPIYDLVEDGEVNVLDLLVMLGSWGACD